MFCNQYYEMTSITVIIKFQLRCNLLFSLVVEVCKETVESKCFLIFKNFETFIENIRSLILNPKNEITNKSNKG
jgi:hypothetical protein